MAHDPCDGNLTATLVYPGGRTSIQKARAPRNPPIDCFYVYPTASTQTTPNASLRIDPGVVAAAELQAARFSQVCKVYAPVYRQLTITGLIQTGITGSKPPPGTPMANMAEPYQDVLSAWNDYLAQYNRGRGVVLIGHSQGSFLLEQLVKQQIDDNPAVLSRIVSVILPGGNVIVNRSPSSSAGATFAHIRPCRSRRQTGCLISYSSFTGMPPPGAIFGYTNGPASPGSSSASAGADEVACTNPASLGGGTGRLETYFPTNQNLLSRGEHQPRVTTAWVSYPDLFSGRCMSAGGASWLRVTDTRKPGDTRPRLTEALGPDWGLHLMDINLAVGNLVGLVGDQSAVYLQQSRAHRGGRVVRATIARGARTRPLGRSRPAGHPGPR